MKAIIRRYNLLAVLLVFLVIPALLWVLSGFPRRTLLKEALSLITLGSFFLMTAQFFLSGFNRLSRMHEMRKVVFSHKSIGYVLVSALILHPFLIVLPRFFEAGVNPIDAFFQIISETGNNGIVLGITAWFLLLLLGLTSLLRSRLGMRYNTWKMFHGILSALLIIFAAWHAISLGRHTNSIIAVYMVLLTAGALSLLFNNYVLKSFKTLKPKGMEHK